MEPSEYNDADCLAFFQVDSELGFVEKTVALFVNETLWNCTSRAALRHARKYFSLTAQANDLDSVVNIALENAKRRW